MWWCSGPFSPAAHHVFVLIWPWDWFWLWFGPMVFIAARERILLARSLGLPGAPWGSLGLPGAPWGSLWLFGASRGSLGLPGVPWGSLGLPGAPWGSLGLPGASWGSLGLSGAPWGFLGLPGAPRGLKLALTAAVPPLCANGLGLKVFNIYTISVASQRLGLSRPVVRTTHWTHIPV